MLAQAIRDFGNTSSQRTVIMTTHNLERGLAMSDRIAILTNGRLAQQVASADLSAEALAQLYYSTVDAANRNRKA
jgi:ABC-type multidrug transport system ATPase subunit